MQESGGAGPRPRRVDRSGERRRASAGATEVSHHIALLPAGQQLQFIKVADACGLGATEEGRRQGVTTHLSYDAGRRHLNDKYPRIGQRRWGLPSVPRPERESTNPPTAALVQRNGLRRRTPRQHAEQT